MKTWIIEPHDSFIARDGRPFGLIPGVRASSLPFPFPSTMAGGVRTRDGLVNGAFDLAQISRVKGLSVIGPLLVELEHNVVKRWYAPAPADALLLDSDPPDEDRAILRRLIPQEVPSGSATNLPPELSLMPLYLPKLNGSYDKRKPHSYSSRFWDWSFIEKWLSSPKDQEVALSDLGLASIPQDERSHVNIQHETQTGYEGMLFQTRGLEFTKKKAKAATQEQLHTSSRLALAVKTDAPNIVPGIASLGGERRLVCWRNFDAMKDQSADLLNAPCPPYIVGAIAKDRACRVVLLTPPYFEAGWKPEWLLQPRHGVTAELKAAAMGRPQVVSGWDFEIDKAKPTRRLVSSGAVFFLKLRGDGDIAKWIEQIWMRTVSDDIDEKRLATDQFRRDGFGLAVLGVWPEGRDST